MSYSGAKGALTPDDRLHRTTRQPAMIFGACTLVLVASGAAIILGRSLGISCELPTLAVRLPVGFMAGARARMRAPLCVEISCDSLYGMISNAIRQPSVVAVVVREDRAG